MGLYSIAGAAVGNKVTSRSEVYIEKYVNILKMLKTMLVA
jgi:hypothetical protein